MPKRPHLGHVFLPQSAKNATMGFICRNGKNLFWNDPRMKK